jgi:alkylhydroperoxidase/carboxymuconolactone decarboxylase family protein YurZ
VLDKDTLDGMTSEEIAESLRLLLAYAKMSDLIEAIKTTYITEDRMEIAESIGQDDEDEPSVDINDDDDC